MGYVVLTNSYLIRRLTTPSDVTIVKFGNLFSPSTPLPCMQATGLARRMVMNFGMADVNKPVPPKAATLLIKCFNFTATYLNLGLYQITRPSKQLLFAIVAILSRKVCRMVKSAGKHPTISRSLDITIPSLLLIF